MTVEELITKLNKYDLYVIKDYIVQFEYSTQCAYPNDDQINEIEEQVIEIDINTNTKTITLKGK